MNSTDPDSFSAPDHPGLISRAALLASGGRSTNPIRRGVKVMRRFLCNDIPSPNSIIIAERSNEPGLFDSEKFANHQIITNVTNKTSCLGCHSQINPMGFLFEKFDPLGIMRPVETVFPAAGQIFAFQLTKSWGLPGPVSNLYIGPNLPTTFNGPDELAKTIADSDAAKVCMSKFLFRHIERRPETALDSCAIEDAADVLRSNQPVYEMFVKSFANEDVLWRGKP